MTTHIFGNFYVLERDFYTNNNVYEMLSKIENGIWDCAKEHAVIEYIRAERRTAESYITEPAVLNVIPGEGMIRLIRIRTWNGDECPDDGFPEQEEIEPEWDSEFTPFYEERKCSVADRIIREDFGEFMDRYVRTRHEIFQNLNERNMRPSERKQGDSVLKRFVSAKNAYTRFDEEVRALVLGQPELEKVTYNVFCWLRGHALGKPVRNNAFICGPSGSGKTEVYRVVRQILEKHGIDIPVIQLDLSQLTAEGFKGKDTNVFFSQLFGTEDGRAIVILDEADKKVVPCTSSGGENVNLEVQNQILTFLEGAKVTNSGGATINTANTLFIACGAFSDLRKRKAKSASKSGIGFGESGIKLDAEDITAITTDDIMEAGASPEFLGRFTTVINLYRLKKDDIRIIAGRYADEFSAVLGIRVGITEEAVDVFYDLYKSSPLGCRSVKNEIWSRITDIGIKVEKGIIAREDTVLIKETGYQIRKKIKKTAEGSSM